MLQGHLTHLRILECLTFDPLGVKVDLYCLWSRVKKELCPLAKSLCLDVNSGVRMVMCEQLNLVIRALG